MKQNNQLVIGDLELSGENSALDSNGAGLGKPSCHHCDNGVIPCPTCNCGRSYIECQECDGKGYVWDGIDEKTRDCEVCDQGEIPPEECPTCFGERFVPCEHC